MTKFARKIAMALFVGALMTAPAFATGAADVTAPIRQFIDAFNRGDTKTAFATYAPGDIQIIDEFAPHRWFGPHAPQDWAAAYDKNAQATGVTDGRVTYGTPTRIEIEGNVAYVVMPTAYLYKEHGVAMAEEGQVTAVLHHEASGWKMNAWTWTGVKPHKAK
jgi:ketosteroid isomerase-like protein